MKVNGQLAIEVERDAACRVTDYTVLSHDEEGNVTQALTFYVNDNGHIKGVTQVVSLVYPCATQEELETILPSGRCRRKRQTDER